MSAAQEAAPAERAAPAEAQPIEEASTAYAAPVGAESAIAPPAYADEPLGAVAPVAPPVGAATTGTAVPAGVTATAPGATAAAPAEEQSDFMKEVTANITHMNPLPEDMDKECEKAGETLDNIINPGKGLDVLIPKSILDNAKGLVIMHVVKAAWGWSGRAGTGIVVAKLPDGTWSAPCAIGMAGAGWGAQVGVMISDLVFVITNDAGLKAFSRGWNVQFGVNVAVAIGPIGREGEVDIVLSDLAPIYTYSKSKGLFAGISLEGSILMQRSGCNEAKYGKGVTGEDILSGKVPRPPNSDHLYNSLAELDRKALEHAKEAAEKMKPTAAAPDF